MIGYIGFTLTIFAALTVGAVAILRRREPAAARPFHMLGYPVTPVVFIATSIWIAYAQVKTQPLESLLVLATLVSGAVVYFILVPTPREGPLPTELTEP